MSAMASDAPVSAPCRAYLVPPWMMPWDFTLCPPPSVPFSTSTVAKPSRRKRALSQRPATPPPTIKTSVLSDSGMERTSRENKAGSINQRQGTPVLVGAGHARENLSTGARPHSQAWPAPTGCRPPAFVGTGHAREWLALRPHLFRERGSLLQSSLSRKLRLHESHPLYSFIPPRPAASVPAPALASQARAGVFKTHRRALCHRSAVAQAGRYLGACGVGRGEHRRGADGPRADGPLPRVADHHHLHDADRLRANQGTVRRQ